MREGVQQMSNSLLTKVIAAFGKIGSSNGTSAPASQDPADTILHELFVADMLKSISAKRRDAALNAAKELIDASRVEETIAYSAKHKLKNSCVLLQSPHYNLRLDTKSPASTFDKAKLVTLLRTQHSFTEDQCAKLLEACSKDSKPAETYTVERTDV
jgi:hypothetical protein